VTRSRRAGPFRVYYLVTDLERGGAEKNLVALATALRGEYEVHAGCLFAPGASAAALRSAGIDVDCFGLARWTDVPKVLAIARRLAALEIDLLHSFLFHANLAGRLAGAIAGTPRVMGSVRVAEQRRWHLLADGLTAALTDLETGTGEAICRYTARRARVSPRKLAPVPIAIDPADYAEPAGAPHGGACRILGVGRLHAQKRWEDTIDALARIRDLAWTARIAGGGPARAALERRIVETGLAGRVELVGPRERIHDEYRASDLVVLSSAWEGMPNTVLEAMGHGLPVVATRVGATDELAADGRTALLVPPRRPDLLARALGELVGDPARRLELGRAGRARAFASFGVEAMVAAHRDLYRSLLAGRSRTFPRWRPAP